MMRNKREEGAGGKFWTEEGADGGLRGLRAEEDGKLEAGRGARLNQRVWKMSVFLATTTTCKSRPTKEERLASEAN